MSLPVRCFTCGNIIGKLELKFNNLLETGLEQENALNTLNVKEYCCRRMFLGYVNMVDQLLLYPEAIDTNDRKNSDTEKQ